MGTIKVLPGQDLLDMAINTTGSVEGLFALAELNGLMPDELVFPGDNLQKPIASNANMLKYLQDNNIVVATSGYEAPTESSAAFSNAFNNGYN